MTRSFESLVTYLDWDSIFFEKRIGLVNTNNMNDLTAEAVDIWAIENHMDCIYYLADGAEIMSARAAESHNYHLMDQRMTFIIDLNEIENDSKNEIPIRTAVQGDLEELRHMASDYHGISRFYADDHFDRAKCNELYEIWIERDLNKPGRFIWVSEDQGKITGYTSASLLQNNKIAEIGLVGVNPQWRGKGIGFQLQLEILRQLCKLGFDQVKVVTQGRNIKAQNLYHKSGYRLTSIDLWYHKWYSNP